MPYSIGIYFDITTETLIRKTWKCLADKELADYYLRSGNRPHITLAIFNDLNIRETEEIIIDFAKNHRTFPISFQQIGLFSGVTNTVFWGPVVTSDLLTLQSEIHQLVGRTGAESGSDYYVPGNWVPHCGLAMEISEKGKITKIIEVCQELPRPHTALITEIGLIKFRPVEQIFKYSLS